MRTRFNFISRQSDTRAWYVHPWASIDTKSMLRSRMSRTVFAGEYALRKPNRWWAYVVAVMLKTLLNLAQTGKK